VLYPGDANGRQKLADELTAKGLKPTQTKQRFDKAKINDMAEAMKDGTIDWNQSSKQPVILGPAGQILSGHHRVVAAHLAGIDLASVPGQVKTLSRSLRPEYRWHQVLPDV
jgi:hypothetical protein